MLSLILWISLPSSWELGNVRAVLALVINFLCVIGIWVVSYSTWKFGALRLTRVHNSSTKLLALYSPTGLGDVVEMIPLLRASMSIRLLAQHLISGALVAMLSAACIVSAPIARYSTRPSTQIELRAVPGMLTTNSHRSIDAALVDWNSTIERFNAAGLPPDQLMDFLPDNTVDWKYSESEWNNSWSASCRWTERTPIEIFIMGNSSTADSSMLQWFQGLRSIFPEDLLDMEKFVRRWSVVGPYRDDVFLNRLIFISIQSNPNISFDATRAPRHPWTNFRPFHYTVAAVHLKNAPAEITTDGDVNWGTGPPEEAWYTMASCDIARVATRTPDNLDGWADWHTAYPWTRDNAPTLDAYSLFHEARLTQQSFRGETIYHPSGQDLFRLYQAYLVTKDVQDYESAERLISVSVPTVELSVPVLAVFLVYSVLTGLTAIWFVVLKRLPSEAWVPPRTKIEWMAQGMRESSAREVSASYLSARWWEIEGELREAEVVTLRDPARNLYSTIQLGSQIRQRQRSLDSTPKA